jgi:hypothetical protein
MEEVMLVKAVTHLDIAFGRIGIALQVQCPVDGSVSWLWGQGVECGADLDDHEPPQSAFLCDPLHDGAESEIIPALDRLVNSGIITQEQHELIQEELGQEALFVFAFWLVRGEPIPSTEDAFACMLTRDIGAPPPMYRPIIGEGSE